MSLEIQIVSDIHAEFWANKTKFNFIKPSAPILALIGDTCCVGSDEDYSVFKKFIEELLPHYLHIIIVSGNHEYYFSPFKRNTQPTMDNTMSAVDNKIKTFCKTSNKLHYLHNSSIKLNIGKRKYIITGSTLWSWIPVDQRDRIKKEMNDYQYIYILDGKKIRHVNPTDISNLYLRNVRYIKSQIIKAKKIGAQLIILTHHKPYLSPKYNVSTRDPAYESDLLELITSPVILWAYGHTHVSDDQNIKKVRVYSNPKGYPKQKTMFNWSSKITIG